MQNNPEIASPDSTNTEEDQKIVKYIVQKLNKLKAKIPESPDFLGTEIKYPAKKNSLFFVKKELPNLGLLREEVNKLNEKKELSHSRKKIRKLLKKYPSYADLHAINGIQIFSDIAQSGLAEKKLDALENSLLEISKALYNDAISIFNVSWMVKIYLKYLEVLKERITHEYSGMKNHYHRQVRASTYELQKSLLQISSMLAVKEKLGGLVTLNAKLKGSVYITDCISKEEIKAACVNIQKDEDTTIGVGKTANYVLLVMITLSLLFARIPILRKLVTEILMTIPDTSKDLILQKNMVRTMLAVTEFQFALAEGDKKILLKLADNLYKGCLTTIKQHITQNILSKPHEVDPFLKAAWIAKESKDLLDKSEYQIRLQKSLDLLKIVLRNQIEIKGSFELARQLRSEIHHIMADHDWPIEI